MRFALARSQKHLVFFMNSTKHFITNAYAIPELYQTISSCELDRDMLHARFFLDTVPETVKFQDFRRPNIASLRMPICSTFKYATNSSEASRFAPERQSLL